MMATVFFMQPLGQTTNNLISLVVVAICKRQGEANLVRTVDTMWRWIIGTGVIPGVIALYFRFTIPETPRFLSEREEIPVKAEFDAINLFNEPIPLSTAKIDSLDPITRLPAPAHRKPSDDEHFLMTQSDDIAIQPAILNSHYHLVSADIIQYFWTEGNWRTLAGTSLSWLFVDFGFHGIGLLSSHFIAKTWGTLNIHGQAPQWMTNGTPGAGVYDMLFETSAQALVILNTGSCIGRLFLVLFSYQLNRVSLQKYGFLALAALFIALGTMLITVKMEGPVAVVFYIIGQLLFNFGMLLFFSRLILFLILY